MPRDLRELLERRWTATPEEQCERVRALIGELEELNTPATEVRLPAGHGRSGQEVADLLKTIRADAPDDPFWRGVAEIRAESDAARVTFHTAVDPPLKRQGGVQVACHLWDPELAPRPRDG